MQPFVIRAVLQFLYTGVFTLKKQGGQVTQFYADLYAVADLFQIDCLKRLTKEQFEAYLDMHPVSGFFDASVLGNKSNFSSVVFRNVLARKTNDNFDAIFSTSSRNRKVLSSLTELCHLMSINRAERVVKDSSRKVQCHTNNDRAHRGTNDQIKRPLLLICQNCDEVAYALYKKWMKCPECWEVMIQQHEVEEESQESS